jgi:hypothetical protein
VPTLPAWAFALILASLTAIAGTIVTVGWLANVTRGTLAEANAPSNVPDTIPDTKWHDPPPPLPRSLKNHPSRQR